MNCPILSSLSKCCYAGRIICSLCTQLTIVAIVIIFGALLAWKPKKAIDIQTALYRPFNWKLEPISMEKEIRNTRIMGMAVLILGIISLVYVLIK
ncbi:MAG: hypothetical protein V2A72_00075 [Candidatus Omnitrophota bacterium]